jgi:hypothetical protein
MYIETLVQPSRTDTVARGPSLIDAVSTIGGGRDANAGQNARFFLNVTAASGTTPSMTVNVYGVVNGQMYFIGAFTAVTVAGAYTLQLNNVPDQVVFAPSPLTGTTPSFTYEIRCVR